MRVALFGLVALLSGCIIEAPAPQAVQPAPQTYPPQADATMAEAPPAEDATAPAESVYVEPPLEQPAPIAVAWAPPPMLVEVPPPEPFPGAVWVGGYWVWQGNWVWGAGHWVAPPRADFVWVHPYYEHRGDAVIFIDGHWSPRGVAFVPPAPGLRLVVEAPAPGVIRGPRPIGPEGCFVPAPPGSRAGIIVPAPIGTAPAVVTSAPAVVSSGMRITNNVTTVNNVTNVTNVTRVTNVTNVTIVAPAGVTANGHAFNTSVPAAPHLAAARPALVRARAPEPMSTRPLPAYVPGSRPPVLPHAPAANAAAFGGHPQQGFEHEQPAHQPGMAATVPPAGHPSLAYSREPQPPLTHEPQPGTAHGMQPGASRDMQPGASRDMQPGAAHQPQPAMTQQLPPGQANQPPGQAHQPPGQAHQAPPAMTQQPPQAMARQTQPVYASPGSGSAAPHAPPPSDKKPQAAHPANDKPHKDAQPQHDPKHDKDHGADR